MRKSLKIIFFSFLFLLIIKPDSVNAHPGNTASDGCHYCRTNCDKWGVEWNERHCHNGKSIPKPTYKPIATIKPTVSATTRPITTSTYTPIPTSNNVTSKSDDGSSSIGWILAGGAGVYGYQLLKDKKK